MMIMLTIETYFYSVLSIIPVLDGAKKYTINRL